MKFLIKVFKLKLELLRKRFDIYGFFNVTSLLLVLFLIAAGVKYFLFRIGHYEEIAWLITIFYFTLFSGSIFVKKLQQRVIREQTFFPEIKVKDFIQFEKYKKWIIYHLIYLYLLFPVRIEEGGIFLCFFVIEQGLLFFLELVHRYLPKEKFLGVRTVLSIAMCMVMVAYVQGLIILPSLEITNVTQIVILMVLNLFLLKWNYQNLEEEKKEETHVYFFKMSKKIPLFRKNKNLLFVVRKNILFDMFLLLILCSVENPKYFFVKSDVIVSYGLTFLICFIWLYGELLNEDSGKLCSFIVSPKQIKKEAIRDVWIISFLFLGMVGLGNFNGISFAWIVQSYLLAWLAFLISAFAVQTTIECGKEEKHVITWKETIYLYVISLVIFLAVNFCLCYNVKK